MLKPRDEPSYSFFDLRLRIVIEQASRFRYVGKCLGHIAGLRGLPVDFGTLA